jgi:outer membrane protein assembly factor BamB
MNLLAITLLPAVLPLALGQSDDKASWPQWKGPDRDGLSRETDWVAEGKNDPLWSAQVGLGYSSVSIADGRLYTMGYDNEGKLDLVWCMDAETGEELWAHAYESKIWNEFHEGGTLTTPTVDGGVVFTTNREGNVYCLDAETGDVEWHQNYFEEHDLEYPQWGFAASPVALEGQLIVNLGKVFSLDKKTGEINWVTENYGHAYSTPTPFELEGTPALAVFNGKGLAILDLEGGEEIFFHAWTQKYETNAASPIVMDDKIYISSGQGHGNALLQITPEGLKPVWENKSMANSMSGCVLVDGHLYGFDDSVLKCMDMKGKELWAERGIGNGALMGGAGKLIVVGSRGELIVAAASPAGFEAESRAQVLESAGVFWSKPVLAGGLIYARGNRGQLVCLDHRATKTAE